MAAFCSNCGAPIGMVSTIDPIQQIHAEGFAYRSAVDGPPRLIVVIGMWALFAPLTMITPFLIPSFFSGNFSAEDIIFGIGLLLFAVGSAVILYRTTRNYIVKSRAVGWRS